MRDYWSCDTDLTSLQEVRRDERSTSDLEIKPVLSKTIEAGGLNTICLESLPTARWLRHVSVCSTVSRNCWATRPTTATAAGRRWPDRPAASYQPRRGQPGKLSMAPGIRCRTGFPSLQHFHQRDK